MSTSRGSQHTPHRLQDPQPRSVSQEPRLTVSIDVNCVLNREFEDPVAREFSVITTDKTRIPVGPGVDLVIEDYNIQTFDDNAVLVLPTDAILQQVDNPLPLDLGPVIPGPPMPMMDC